MKIEAQQILCEIITENRKKGHMMYRKNFTFNDLVGWVCRNCTGSQKIEVYLDKEVVAYFDNRVEIYTMQTVDVSEAAINEEKV